MSEVSTVEMRLGLADAINRASYAKERIVITRRGRKIAALIPFEDYEALEALEDEIDTREARKALKDVEKNGSVAWEDVKHKLGL